MIYLDNAATTKMHKEVIDEMTKCMINVYGNPSSLYYPQAVQAKALIEESRRSVADLFDVSPECVVFTSGATESNNLVLKGIAFRNLENKGRIIISSVEHSSIIETSKFLETLGFEIIRLGVSKNGTIDINDLERNINKETLLVSIMWVNNETGAINPIEKIAEICLNHEIPFHTDATQAVGKIECDFGKINGLDFLSMSAHKIYGPKGIGAIICNTPNSFRKLTPLLHGGDQEYGIRAGTLPTHQIVGLGTASRITQRDFKSNISKLTILEEQLKKRLHDVYGMSAKVLDDIDNKALGIINVQFRGLNNQVLLKSIANEISASSGAACSNTKPSHVLKAMGYSDEVIRETLRLSFSPYEDYLGFSSFQ